jgi:hypothetical protein
MRNLSSRSSGRLTARPKMRGLSPVRMVSSLQQRSSKFAMPKQDSDFRQFLAITDGANLFAAPGPSFPDPSIKNPYVRFALFGCEDLVRMNAILLWQFREVYSVEAEFEAVTQLNYLAFCDAGDADFQALLRDANDHRVFLLFHEFTYRPYSLRDTTWYYDIAPSLESWFELILRTGGWGGRGSKGGL